MLTTTKIILALSRCRFWLLDYVFWFMVVSGHTIDMLECGQRSIYSLSILMQIRNNIFYFIVLQKQFHQPLRFHFIYILLLLQSVSKLFLMGHILSTFISFYRYYLYGNYVFAKMFNVCTYIIQFWSIY